jgi:hypothetical protein
MQEPWELATVKTPVSVPRGAIMPTLPWLSGHPVDPTTTAVVMASRFRLRQFRQVPRFLLDSIRIHRQVRASDGALGVSLIAHPLRREFLTPSAWRDRDALHALVRTEPHRPAMCRHRPAMAESTFTSWEVPVAQLPVPWDEARRRLDAERTAGGPARRRSTRTATAG